MLISGFRRYVDEICALLGYYAASCGNCLPTFRDNVSVSSSRVNNYYTTLRNIPEERRYHWQCYRYFVGNFYLYPQCRAKRRFFIDYLENGGRILLRNSANKLPNTTASSPVRLISTNSALKTHFTHF
jgi:hypothetical protein